MTDPTEVRDPSEQPPANARPPEPPEDEGDEGEDEGEDEAPAGQAAPGGQQPGAAPGQPGGRKRRRRRRRKGAQVFFTPEGQAYRMQPGPGGQPVQVLLTPEELQAYQQRQQPVQQQQPGAQPRPQQQQAQPRPPRAEPQLQPVEGVLDTEAKGPNAYLRQLKKSLLPSPDDAELPKNLVQKLRLRQGQYVTALAQMKGHKGTVQRVETADGVPLDRVGRLPHFADLTSIDPIDRIKVEAGAREMVTRVLDLIAPIGKGTRGLIVAPPKTGKTIMLQRIAQAVIQNHPEVHVMVVLIDERPEEVTDMRRSIKAEVLASSSDRPTG
ncbi:MAG: transcription termination factor Rho, partial [Myxococcaceae bacterium]|nr:transcription termination factor Rho [Myxococcaceae bacterium]